MESIADVIEQYFVENNHDGRVGYTPENQ